jgi:hypothetical protein
MRKILFLLFLLPSVILHGQFIPKGNILTSGTTSFSHRSTTGAATGDSKSSTFNISLFTGYSVINNLVMGISLGSTLSKTQADYSTFNPVTGQIYQVPTKSTYKYLTLGPVVRYYLKNGFFVHANIEWGNSKGVIKNTIEDSSTKYKSRNWKTGVGYAYRLSDSILLEPFIGYSSDQLKGSGFKYSSSGLIISAGFTVLLPMN